MNGAPGAGKSINPEATYTGRQITNLRLMALSVQSLEDSCTWCDDVVHIEHKNLQVKGTNKFLGFEAISKIDIPTRQ